MVSKSFQTDSKAVSDLFMSAVRNSQTMWPNYPRPVGHAGTSNKPKIFLKVQTCVKYFHQISVKFIQKSSLSSRINEK